MTPDPIQSGAEGERCPTCGSDHPPSMYGTVPGAQSVPAYCPDPFHRPETPPSEGEKRLRDEIEQLKNDLLRIGAISRHALPVKGRSLIVDRLDAILLSVPPSEGETKR